MCTARNARRHVSAADHRAATRPAGLAFGRRAQVSVGKATPKSFSRSW
jgi:hypothetical protein